MSVSIDIDKIPLSEFRGRSYGKGYAKVGIDTTGINLDDFGYKVRKAVKHYLESDGAPFVREYMKENHRWKNRTRTAEVGLTCDVVSEGNMKTSNYSIHLEMYHTAKHNGYEYGRALEGIDPIHGVYRTDLGVLKDTLEKCIPVVVSDMRGIVNLYGGM